MTHNFKKILIGTGTSVHIQNTMTCNATLYPESKTYNKCKRFPKKRGGGMCRSCACQRSQLMSSNAVTSHCVPAAVLSALFLLLC